MNVRDPAMNRRGVCGRSAARFAVVQALYQIEAAGTGVDVVLEEFRLHRLEENSSFLFPQRADGAFFTRILKGTMRTRACLDRCLEESLADGWKLSRIDSTARAILRAALFELASPSGVPEKVVFDEYLTIAGAFLDGKETAFVNGVLDRVAGAVREGKCQSVPVDDERG